MLSRGVYDEYIILGTRFINAIEWCKNNGKSYYIIPENWSEKKKFQEAELYLKNVKEILMQYAMEILNEYHHTQYGVEAWKILIGPWMYCYA